MILFVLGVCRRVSPAILFWSRVRAIVWQSTLFGDRPGRGVWVCAPIRPPPGGGRGRRGPSRPAPPPGPPAAGPAGPAGPGPAWLVPQGPGPPHRARWQGRAGPAGSGPPSRLALPNRTRFVGAVGSGALGPSGHVGGFFQGEVWRKAEEAKGFPSFGRCGRQRFLG